MSHKHKKRREAFTAVGSGPVFEELESRLLLSADVAPLVDPTPVAEPAIVQQIDADVSNTTTTSETAPAAETRKELVLIDPRVADYGNIVSDILDQNSSSRQIDVLVLDPQRDGVQQVNEALAGRNDLSALHVISHGVAGQFSLGDTQLNFESLLANARAIQEWGNAFTEDADIMLYGCNVGATAEGQQLVDALSRLTGADVAASDDTTGNIIYGGDWTLEVASGSIEAQVAPSAALQTSWNNVLAFTAQGGETRVNTTTANWQGFDVGFRQVAMDSSGNYVVVWNSNGQDTAGTGVYGQRYNASGVAQGAQFRVNTTQVNNESRCAVSMDASGNFIVVWDSDAQDGSGHGIYAQRYNAAGTAQGAEFRVNTTTVGDQQYPVVERNAGGSFIVMWESNGQDGSLYGVYAQRYNAAGVAQGGEFRINTFTTNDQAYSSIAMDDSGNFIATWSSNGQDGSSQGVYGQRYNAAGVAQGSEFQINTFTTGFQALNSVSCDSSGNFVVVWSSTGQDGSSNGVYGQRYNAAGVAQGGEFQVNVTTADDQFRPVVSVRPSGGFVVTWASNLQDGAGYGVFMREYDPAGNAITGEVQVNTTTAGDQYGPSVAVDDNGHVVVVWQGNGTGDADGVFMQRYRYTVAPTLDNTKTPALSAVSEDAGAPVGAVGTLISSLVDFAVPSGQVDNVTDADAGALLGIAVTATDTTNGTWWYSTNGGTSWNALGAVTGTSSRLLAADANTRIYFQSNADYNGTVANAITFRAWDQTSGTNGALADTSTNGGITAFSTATDTASIVVTAVNDAPVITSNSGGASASIWVAENTTAVTVVTATDVDLNPLSYSIVGGADAALFTINSSTGALSFLSARDFQTPADAGANNVYDVTVRVSDGAGGTDTQAIAVTVSALSAQGSETRVNTTTANGQGFTYGFRQVAMDANGNYVVVWESNLQDGSGGGIYAQRYNAAGVAQGGEFRVNTTTINNQGCSSVAMDASGNFVVIWHSDLQDGSGLGIYAQRYNAAGVAQGGEFRVNTTTANIQQYPAIAMNASGSFIIAWESDLQDGSSLGIYAQRYNAAGVAQGGEFLVNTTTTDNQSYVAVAIDNNGNFIVAWHSYLQDGSGFGVYAQRYNAAGVAQGGEFRVNTTTASEQTNPSIGIDINGNFVIAWNSYDQDGSGNGIFAQRYNAAGVAQGSEFQINTSTVGNQEVPIVSMRSSGEFFVTWRDGAAQDSSSYGSYIRQYDANGNAVTGEILVNTTVTGDQSNPSVAVDNNGHVVVVWTGNGPGDADGVFMQRYLYNTPPVIASNGGGAAASLSVAENTTVATVVAATDADLDTLSYSIVGGADAALFTINSSTGALSFLSAPDFQAPTDAGANNVYDVTVQVSDGSAGTDTQALAITVERLSAQGSETRVNSTTANTQDDPTVAMDANGNYVVLWVSDLQDGSGNGVYARRYNAAGVAQGAEFRVNTTTANDQNDPIIAMNASGSFVIAWASNRRRK